MREEAVSGPDPEGNDSGWRPLDSLRERNTGIGDVSPVVADGVVPMDAVADAKKESEKTTMDTRLVVFDAESSRTLWQHNMGRGPKPPAFKGGIPMVHDGIAYVGTPVNNIYQAHEIKSGKRLWTWHVPNPEPAGSSRGSASYYEGALYISTDPTSTHWTQNRQGTRPVSRGRALRHSSTR